MTTIDHAAELHRAGANVDGKLAVFLFYCRRHPLGTIGGVIFVMLVVAARGVAPAVVSVTRSFGKRVASA